MSENSNQQELKAILKKYLNNEASLAERRKIDSWYQALGADRSGGTFFFSKDKQLHNSIKAFLNHQIYQRKKSWWSTVYVKYTVASLFIIGLGMGWYTYDLQKYRADQKEIVISTVLGTQKQITLPDGSAVLLNEQSKLTVSKDFGKNDRKVNLVGEAFFKVAKNKQKPFIIRSGNLKTRVLGTSFNINAYPNMERIKISVMTGRVKVSKTGHGHDTVLANAMVKNQTISFYKNTEEVELRNEDTGLITSWRDNKLYIDNASINDIASQLDRYYHVSVVYKEKSALKDKYTIRFNKESMQGVLKILSVLTKKKFLYYNNQITIK